MCDPQPSRLADRLVAQLAEQPGLALIGLGRLDADALEVGVCGCLVADGRSMSSRSVLGTGGPSPAQSPAHLQLR